jgi:UDP-N-acetylmuramoyl-tripeptide--D-alanyl-D-alanine ligase
MDVVRLAELVAATGGRLVAEGSQEVVIRRVVIDSRDVQPGDVFWALRGEHHDGHNFVEEAHRRGAAISVVQCRPAICQAAAVVEVADTLVALGDFARWYRQQHEALVIGVTGSVGKTTTREMLHAVLSITHAGSRSLKNFNNHIGLPLSLLQIQKEDEFAVLELGASHIGEIRDLCRLALPEVGVIPKVGLAHIEGFGSPNGVYEAKGELLEALPAHGFAVLGGDDDRLRLMAPRGACPVIFVGERDDCSVRGTEIEVGENRLGFRVGSDRFTVPVTGRHYLTSALCAVAVAREIGLTATQIAAGLRGFTPVAGRCVVQHIGDWTIIDDTYNANPTSMQAACRLLADWSGSGKRILVIGDMLELGDQAADYHTQLGRLAADAKLNLIVVLGEQAGHVIRGALSAGFKRHQLAECSDMAALTMVLDCSLDPGDVILVKGSRGMRMERVIEWLQQRAVLATTESNRQTESRRQKVA